MKCERERELFEQRGVTDAVLRLALPTVMGQVVLVIYNMADTFFVGLTGNVALLAAVTVCMPAFLFLSAISGLFGIGGASVIARALGDGKEARASLASSFALWGCLALSALYGAGVWLGRDGFVDLLGGTDPAVHQSAVQYLLVTVTLGGVCNAAGVLLSHLLRAEGRSLHAGISVALGGVANILLDPLFMFVLLPPGHEALGAAIATALSGVLSLLYNVIVLWLVRRDTVLSFRPSRAMLRERIPGDILAAGLPACVMTLAENISYAVLDKLMSLNGLTLQAGIGVAKKVNMLAHCIVRGIAQGSLPLIAYNFSSGNHERMRASVTVARRLAVGVAALCALGSFLASRPLVGLFIRGDGEALEYGAAFLRILCIGGPFSAGAYCIISFFQATGEGGRSFLLAVLRKGLLDIPLMFLLGSLFPIFGIVAATPAADLVCFLTSQLMFSAYLRRLDTGGILLPLSRI